MQSCSSALCILILLITTFTTVSVSAVLPLKVNLHDSATLSCSERCSGLVRWSVFHKSTDALAECDQTSCRSKEGYQMIHDQYLKGNLSLIITDADFSKRGWYTCQCDGKDICDVRLQIEPLNTPVQLKPGASLEMNLDVSEPVEVLFYSTAGPSSGQICKVAGRLLECKPEYKHRVSLTSALELRGMTPSDSGVYVIQDTKNKEDIHIYKVTVQDNQLYLDRDKRAAEPNWMQVLIVAIVAGVCGGSAILNELLRREIQELTKAMKQDKKETDANGKENAEKLLSSYNP
ncbi:uncharacterized protein LOC118826929 isoform X2 [Colossoma macropomum]|nr:uncharacterized protein LOC118826929 isoform X2 [Colossoma macropomum]XP_036453908.1 uncharacterized protein LOC118826929 isoform X2 [Colossoma macropomum]